MDTLIELPFPAKILWPNGRGHHMAKHREFKKHKEWAKLAMLAHMPCRYWSDPPKRIDWSVTFYPKTRHLIDTDNAISCLKAYQDGLALAMRIDDQRFNAPTLHFGEPAKPGKVVIRLGAV